MSTKALYFKVRSEFANFRMPETNSSNITYKMMPISTAKGLVAAIVGRGKNDYQEDYSGINITIIPEKSLKKTVVVKRNLLIQDLKAAATTEYTQSYITYVLNPEYGIVINEEGFKDYQKLKDHLTNGTTVYLPYLGVAHCQANIDFVGEFDIEEKIANNYVKIDSIVSKNSVINGELDVLNGESIFSEKLVTDMNCNREVNAISRFIYSIEGLGIKVKNVRYFEIGDKKCCF